MRVLIVGGEASLEASLRDVLGRCCPPSEVQRWSRAELDSPANDPADAARARALLFEAYDDPGRASAALAVVRAERGLRELPALVALSMTCGNWLEPVCAFDDFLAYPWQKDELLGRISALERRRQSGSADVMSIGAVSVDEDTRTASVEGSRVQLTVREFALLAYLSRRRGRVLSREHLLEQVWGVTYRGGPRTVDVHVRRLRAKLGAALHIETVRSGGYKLCAEPG